MLITDRIPSPPFLVGSDACCHALSSMSKLNMSDNEFFDRLSKFCSEVGMV